VLRARLPDAENRRDSYIFRHSAMLVAACLGRRPAVKVFDQAELLTFR
jgi:hypothetical protein